MKKLFVLILVIVGLISCNKKVSDDVEINGGYGKPLTIVLDWVPNTNHTGLFVAKELGYFEEEGINDIEIVQPPEGSTTALIGSGKAEFGISFQDTLAKTFASDNPIPVTAIATIMQTNTSGILMRVDDVNNFDPSKLEKIRYATWEDPIEQAIVKKIMINLGINYDKVEMIPNTITDVVSALKTDIDAVWVYYGWDGIAAEQSDLNFEFIPITFGGSEVDFYSPVIIANNEFLDNNPDVAKKVMKAISRGYEYAFTNPEESAKILLKYAPELSEELVVDSQKFVSSYYIMGSNRWGEINANTWDNFYNWLYQEKIINKNIEKGYGFSNEFLPGN